MDKGAVIELAKWATLGVCSDLLHDNNIVAIPNDYKLSSLEAFKESPNLYKASFKTSILSEFEAYVHANAIDNTCVFIDHLKMEALCIIDMGTHSEPQWGKHRASIQLIPTTAYSALLKFALNTFAQQDFIDFCEDYKENIAFFYETPETADKTYFSEHIKTLRKLKSSTLSSNEQNSGNFSASRSALESIEIQADNHTPPDGFLFTATPYDGFPSITIACSLRAILDNNDKKDIKLTSRIMQLDSVKESIGVYLRTKLSASFQSNGDAEILDIAVFIGEIHYQ